MNRFLVMKEYIIRLNNVISKIKQTIRVRPSRWVTEEYSSQWYMFFNVWSKGVIINFVYPNHV